LEFGLIKKQTFLKTIENLLKFLDTEMANSKCHWFGTPIDMLPDEVWTNNKSEIIIFLLFWILLKVLTMIFNRLNFHGHLRLSGVCIRWKNLVQNDVLFMNTVKFKALEMDESHTLMCTYKHVEISYDYDSGPGNFVLSENLQLLLNTVETIDFDSTKRAIMNLIMPLCVNLKAIQPMTHFSDNDAMLTFNHPLPVKISSTESTEFLDRFSMITEILQMDFHAVPTEELMAKYGGVIKSISINFNFVFCTFDGWSRFGNLRLQRLRLTGPFVYRSENDEKLAVRSFFEQQAPFIKTMDVRGRIANFIFDPMRMLLRNLEKIEINCSNAEDLRLNDLKVLPKLKSLIYSTSVSEDGEYRLDIVELATLVELRIITMRLFGPGSAKLLIVSRNSPLNAMRKLSIFGFRLDIKSLQQIAQTMPRLKKLTLKTVTETTHYLCSFMHFHLYFSEYKCSL
jgi:F-box domain